MIGYATPVVRPGQAEEASRLGMMQNVEKATAWASNPAPTRPALAPVETPNVIAVVISQDFPDLDVVRDTISKGASIEKDAVWVVRGTPVKEGDAMHVVINTLREAGVEPLHAETNRTYWGNKAGNWRDNEMVLYSKMTVIFHDKKSGTTKWFADRAKDPYLNRGQLHLIERGHKKQVQRKGRKPVGV